MTVTTTEQKEWAVLWAHASHLTMAPEKVLSDYPGDTPFTSLRAASEWASRIAVAGGFDYILVTRRADGSWVTTSGADPLDVLRGFVQTGRWVPIP